MGDNNTKKAHTKLTLHKQTGAVRTQNTETRKPSWRHG